LVRHVVIPNAALAKKLVTQATNYLVMKVISGGLDHADWTNLDGQGKIDVSDF
jgi:hypothetical protein